MCFGSKPSSCSHKSYTHTNGHQPLSKMKTVTFIHLFPNRYSWKNNIYPFIYFLFQTGKTRWEKPFGALVLSVDEYFVYLYYVSWA